jgi:hypothetical protein
LESLARCDDGSCTPETPYAFRDFLRFLKDGLASLGSDLLGVTKVKDEMSAAGFEKVTHHMLKCPIGPWARDHTSKVCGLFLRTVIMDGLRGLSRKPFMAGLGWTQIQIEMFLIDVRRDVMNSAFHTYLPFHIVYGRKPLV